MHCPVVRIVSSHPSQGDFVEINATDFDAARHTLYDAPPELPPPPAPMPPPPAPMPPPPAPIDPLANLPRAWRERPTSWLRTLAEEVSSRTPETREQAVQMIEAALNAKLQGRK